MLKQVHIELRSTNYFGTKKVPVTYCFLCSSYTTTQLLYQVLDLLISKDHRFQNEGEREVGVEMVWKGTWFPTIIVIMQKFNEHHSVGIS